MAGLRARLTAWPLRARPPSRQRTEQEQLDAAGLLVGIRAALQQATRVGFVECGRWVARQDDACARNCCAVDSRAAPAPRWPRRLGRAQSPPPSSGGSMPTPWRLEPLIVQVRARPGARTGAESSPAASHRRCCGGAADGCTRGWSNRSEKMRVVRAEIVATADEVFWV